MLFFLTFFSRWNFKKDPLHTLVTNNQKTYKRDENLQSWDQNWGPWLTGIVNLYLSRCSWECFNLLLIFPFNFSLCFFFFVSFPYIPPMSFLPSLTPSFSFRTFYKIHSVVNGVDDKTLRESESSFSN